MFDIRQDEVSNLYAIYFETRMEKNLIAMIGLYKYLQSAVLLNLKSCDSVVVLLSK